MYTEEVTETKILSFAGSLRKASYNRGLLRAAQDEPPDDTQVEIFDLGDLPFYNGDVEDLGDPPAVEEFKERISEADAVLIATPEYSRSITGVLKNALDWASRPPADPPLKNKPVSLIGASPGRLGTVSAQSATRPVLFAIGAYVLPSSQVLISGAQSLFDEHGNLVDEDTRQRVRKQVEALVDWTRRLALMHAVVE